MDFTLRFIQIFFIALWYAIPLIVFLALMITILGRVIGIKEGWSRADSIYYAFITATTVGYGDFYPKKRLSKHLAIAISFIGIILTGIIVALALQAASITFKQDSDYKYLVEDIQKIEKSYE